MPARWVRVAASRLVIDGARRRAVAARYAGLFRARDTSGPEDWVADGIRVHTALAQLPARTRQIVSLYYLADLAVAEIAVVLRMSEGAVKASLHRARGQLAAMLETVEDQC